MKASRHFTASCLSALILAAALSGCGKSPEAHFEQGKALFDKGDSQGAILELKNVLQEAPGHNEARLMLGLTYLAVEDYVDAIKELERAMQSGVAPDRVLPSLARAYLRMSQPQKVLDLGIPPGTLNRTDLATLQAIRAEAMEDLGKKAEAQTAIRAAEEVEGDNPDLLVLKARKAIQAHNLDEAKKYIYGALLRNPGFVHAYYVKASIEETEERFADAIQTYKEALKHDPKAFRAHLAMAHAELRQGKLDASEKAMLAAEKSAPNHPLVRHGRGVLELSRGNAKAAEEALLMSLRAAPDHIPSKLALAMAHLGQGQNEQSIKLAQFVLAQTPDDPVARRVLAASQLQSGAPQDALSTLVPLLNTGSPDSKLLQLAGSAHLRNQAYEQALEALKKAEELDPENPIIKQQKAISQMGMGQESLARATLEQAVATSPEAGRAELALIGLYLLRGEYDTALAAIAALEKKMPASPLPHELRATALMGKQDQAGARKALESALSKDPKYFPAVAKLARVDMSEGKTDAAEKRFNEFLSREKDHLPALLSLAGLAQHRNQPQVAEDLLQRAIKAHPQAVPPRSMLIAHHLSQGQNAKALQIAQAAVNEQPDAPLALELLGTTQLAAGDTTAATATYEQLVRKAPQSPQAHLRLGLAYMAAQAPAKARASLDQAVKLDPKFAAAMDAQARLAMKSKAFEQALQWTRRIQNSHPQSALGFEREGDVLMALQRYQQAAKAYQFAVGKHTGGPVLVKLHAALIRTGDERAALAKVEEWTKAHPDDLNARAFLAGQLVLAGQSSRAIGLYESILRKNPNHVLALNELALLYQAGNDARARPTAEHLLKLEPNNPVVLDTVGWIFAQQGLLPQALPLLKTAAAKSPTLPTVHYHYGAALAKAGKGAEARKALEAALAMNLPFDEKDVAASLLKTLR
ncbi:MAG: XrtA/PEP-CTERM system TPR-repeat protein PrsT [Pseudomonadota bacterium]